MWQGLAERVAGWLSPPLDGADGEARIVAAIGDGRDQEAERLLRRRTGARRGGSVADHFRLGSSLAVRHPPGLINAGRALRQFQCAARALTPETVSPEAVTLAAMATTIDLLPDLGRRLPPLPACWRALDSQTPEAGPDDASAPVVLFAADSTYFRRFFKDALASLRCHLDHRHQVHVHLVNPEGADLRTLARMTRADRALTWSRQTIDPAIVRLRYDTQLASYRRDVILYQCLRFLVAPALIARFGRPLLILDIDLTLERDGAALLAEGARCDVGIVDGPAAGRFNVSTALSAAVVWIGNTPAGRSTLDVIARTLHRHLFQAGCAPFQDQLALHGACYVGRMTGDVGRLVRFPADVHNADPTCPVPRGQTLFVNRFHSLNGQSALGR